MFLQEQQQDYWAGANLVLQEGGGEQQGDTGAGWHDSELAELAAWASQTSEPTAQLEYCNTRSHKCCNAFCC